MTTKPLLLLLLCLCGCTKEPQSVSPTRAEILHNTVEEAVDVHGWVASSDEKHVGLSSNLIDAYFRWDEWKKTNVYVLTVSFMSIPEHEYRELTNWLASHPETITNTMKTKLIEVGYILAGLFALGCCIWTCLRVNQ